jgi:hypothetical protein
MDDTKGKPLTHAEVLERLRQKFIDGDKAALLEAMYYWMWNYEHDSMPRWLFNHFLNAYEAVRQAQAKSWDDVFGEPWPKGRHVESLGYRYRISHPLYELVERAREAGTPVDDRLFEEVGAQFDVKKTIAKQIYYATKHFIDGLESPGGITLEPGEDGFLPPKL